MKLKKNMIPVPKLKKLSLGTGTEYTKNAFTLVELIVVITILAILATLGFIAFSWNTSKAEKVKLQTNVKNIDKLLATKLSMWDDITDYLTGNLMTDNWVNPSAIINLTNTGTTTASWAHTLSTLKYKVWKLNFYKLKAKWDEFKIETDFWKKDYIFSYLKMPGITLHQIAWGINNEAIIYWKFYNRLQDWAKWLISEKGFNIWLYNWDTLTWSLY